MLGGILLEWFGSLAVPGWAGLGGSVLGGSFLLTFLLVSGRFFWLFCSSGYACACRVCPGCPVLLCHFLNHLDRLFELI